MPWLLNNKPYKVQTVALEMSYRKEGFAYFMEMGLGKTGVTLADYLNIRNTALIQHLIVVCPNSLKRNWRDEVQKWGVDAEVYIWPEKPRFIMKNGKSTGKVEKQIVWIFNYESMLFSGGEALEQFLDNNACMVALDESSRIKNHNAKTTKRLIAMSTKAPIRRILTGTPMSQSVMDLWPQLRFIGELKGVNVFAFRNRFAIMGGYMGKQVVGIRNEAELQELMKRCVFQAKKKDWTDLPEKIYTTRTVEMTKLQQESYNKMKRDFLVMVKEETIEAPMIITQLNKLQQISRGFIYDESREAIDLVEPDRNPCIDVIHEIMEEVTGKVIVVAQFRHSMHTLYSALYKYNPARIMGGMTDEELDEEKKKFNEDSSCRMIINQIGVGGIGHTLLGGKGDDRCSTQIYYENTYSLEKRLQAEDRNHRIGQDKACLYIDLVASPMDRKLINALQKKEDIVKAVMDGVKNDDI